MRPSVKVLIYVDQRRRDLYPMMKIADMLTTDERYDVRLSGKSDFLFAVVYFRPHIIIFGRNDGYHGDWLRAISGCIVISINTEQGYADAKETYNNFMEGHKYPRAPAHDRVDYHFLVSDLTKKHLIPYIEESKLIVVGYTRLMRGEFATEARECRNPLVLGIACGEDIGGKERIQSYFSSYLEKPFGYLHNVQGFLAFHLLDRCWANLLSEALKAKYRVIARYRFGDNSYLIDEEGVEIDKNTTPEYFFKECDVVIMGQSTIGIEAMMFGVPAISTARMIDPGFRFTKVSTFPYIDVCWQPENVGELLSLIEARGRNELALGPKPTEYAEFVSSTYYNRSTKDRCMSNILEFAGKLELKGEAQLDLEILFALRSVSMTRKGLLRTAKCFGAKLIYYLVNGYLLIRRRAKRATYEEIYVPELDLGGRRGIR